VPTVFFPCGKSLLQCAQFVEQRRDGTGELEHKLGVYSALEKGPIRRSYAGKLFLLTLCAVLVPLLTLLVLMLSDSVPGNNLIAWIGIVMSLLALGLAYLGIKAMLEPLQAINEALEAFSKHGSVPDLETTHADLAGRLMAQTQTVLAELEHNKKAQVVDHTIDPLTGLLNQRSATRRLGSDLLRAMRDKSPVCVAVVEVDNLAELTEKHGDAAEDKVIKFVAGKISWCLRRSDWVACLGRHEFLVGLWGVDLAHAELAMKRVIEAVSQSKKVSVRLAIGVAESSNAQTPDRIIALAVAAAAKSRKGGGNIVELDLTSA
jgi:diguanylate cyclase (GGDEF)-like protein